MSNECQCDVCRAACTFKPGWFLPGEAEKAAEYLGMSLEEFFTEYLGVDWWEESSNIFLLAPATDVMLSGAEYPANPRGQCVFYKNDLCKIHPVKPHECAEFSCEDTDDIVVIRHKETAHAWKDHQTQIKTLLGHEPNAEEMSFSGFLDMILGE